MGQQGKGSFFTGGRRFLAENGAQGPRMFFAVDVGHRLYPAKEAASFVWQRRGPFLFGAQFQEGLELLPQFGRAALLEGDHKVPAMLPAQREGAATAIQAVQAQAEAQLREAGLERDGQAIEGLADGILVVLLMLARSV